MSVCKHGFRSSFISYFMKDALRRGFLRLSRVLPISRVFTSGYVNTETILHFFIQILMDKLVSNLQITTSSSLSSSYRAGGKQQPATL